MVSYALRRADEWAGTFACLDTHAEAQLGYREFSAFFTEVGERMGNDAHLLRRIFALIDENGNGQIDKQEMLGAVRGDVRVWELLKLSETLQPLMRPQTWESTFNAMDTNNDGVVDFQDFLKFVDGFKRGDTRYDLDQDGQTGFSDFLAFARAFGRRSS